MDFPIFHLSFFGDRFLFVVIAIIHTIVNHGFAIGLVPIISIMEFRGLQSKNTEWDDLAYNMMRVVFIVTTTVGAATGVGIWFSASLVNPNSIGSLIRVFFSAWLFEWIIFVSEVALVMFYYLTWKKWTLGISKEKHFAVGYFLTIFSWVTMAIIVAILGFMMDPGDWEQKRTFWYGFLNPIYLPQLAFRTFLALLLGGSVALFLIHAFTKRTTEIRQKAVRFVSLWVLAVAPLALVAGWWYWFSIPDLMKSHLSVALGTIQFQNWYKLIIQILVSGVILAVILALVQLFKPKFKYAIVFYAILALWLSACLGVFERAREFVRKPFIIKNYMYANGYKVEDYPLLLKDGILKHADFVSTKVITPDNKVEAGKNVFMLACAQCHTINGMNSTTANYNRMYGANKPWDRDAMHQYIRSMHNARTYMPPFPGNEEEIDALVTYFKVTQYQADPEINKYGYTKLSITKEQNKMLMDFMNSKDSVYKSAN
ncbi:MAG: c-type cytochrome [Paludibacter sp.]